MEIVSKFNFQGNELKVYGTNENPMFRAKEVGELLGLVNIRKNLRDIPTKWKGVTKSDTLGGQQNMVYINEPALYKLAFRSNKPFALEFVDWVCEEVLPTIRKTGKYELPEANRFNGGEITYSNGTMLVEKDGEMVERLICKYCKKVPRGYKTEETLERHITTWHKIFE